jgi:hypothetical protein
VIGFRGGARKIGLRATGGLLECAGFLTRRAGAALRAGRLTAFLAFARAGLRAFEAETFRAVVVFRLRALPAAVFLAAFLAGAFACERLIALVCVALRAPARPLREDA